MSENTESFIEMLQKDLRDSKRGTYEPRPVEKTKEGPHTMLGLGFRMSDDSREDEDEGEQKEKKTMWDSVREWWYGSVSDDKPDNQQHEGPGRPLSDEEIERRFREQRGVPSGIYVIDGDHYYVEGVVDHTESDRELVMYRPVGNADQWWATDKEDFLSKDDVGIVRFITKHAAI